MVAIQGIQVEKDKNIAPVHALKSISVKVKFNLTLKKIFRERNLLYD